MAISKTQALTTGITIFDHQFDGTTIYQQYRSHQWLRDYSQVVANLKQELYSNQLATMWETINVAGSESDYLTYYTKWLFGLYRPLGGASLAEYYDTGRRFDSDMIYDDAQSSNGLITAEQYLKYIKFIIDYQQPTWTMDWVIKFVSEYCNVDPDEIGVDFSDKTQIGISLPLSDVTNEFVKLEINYRDEMGLPFGNVLSFIVRTETDILERYVVYSPYNCVFKKFQSDLITKANSKYSISYIEDMHYISNSKQASNLIIYGVDYNLDDNRLYLETTISYDPYIYEASLGRYRIPDIGESSYFAKYEPENTELLEDAMKYLKTVKQTYHFDGEVDENY